MLLLKKRDKRQASIEKELRLLLKKEEQFRKQAQKKEASHWKTELEKKVPDKVYNSLEAVFNKAFSTVLKKGVKVIEKTYNKAEIEENYLIQDYVVQMKGNRKSLKQIKSNANRSSIANCAITTVEGVGLGALGVGLPDVVLFIGMLLKGIYQTALGYGFTYNSVEEQVFILCMMEAALTKGADYEEKNAQVDRMIDEMPLSGDSDLHKQLEKTASAFAVDMLLLKFVQGLPIIGIIGGAANPIYYNKIMRYVQLKYQKRYLMMVAKRSS